MKGIGWSGKDATTMKHADADTDTFSFLCTAFFWRVVRWILTCIELHITDAVIVFEDVASERALELGIDGIHFEGSPFLPDTIANTASSSLICPTRPWSMHSTFASMDELGYRIG